MDADILLIWPQTLRPSIMSPATFRRAEVFKFTRIPHINLALSWDECLGLTEPDWRIFRQACSDGLKLARTRRWTSNVIV